MENYFTYLCGEREYGFLDIIVYSALSRCKIWPKIFKEFKGKTFKDKQYMKLMEAKEEEEKSGERKEKK